jgi:hypothetical protein
MEIGRSVHCLSRPPRRRHVQTHLLCRAERVPDEAHGVGSVDLEMDVQQLSPPLQTPGSVRLVLIHCATQRLREVDGHGRELADDGRSAGNDGEEVCVEEVHHSLFALGK